MELVTNAPASWGRVTIDDAKVASTDDAAGQAANTLLLCAGLLQAGRELVSMRTDVLLPDGLVSVPARVKDPDAGAEGVRDVFFYPRATKADGAHFAFVRTFWSIRGRPDPVWFAGAALPSAEPADPARVLRTLDFTALKLDPDFTAGHYAMWWRGDGPDFLGGPAHAALKRIYAAFDRRESYVMPTLVNDLGLAQVPGNQRIALPEGERTIPVSGPEHRKLVLTFGQEKGVRFFFDMKTTPPAYRDGFLGLFADYAEAFVETLAGCPRDPDGPRPRRFWEWLERTSAGGMRLIGDLKIE